MREKFNAFLEAFKTHELWAAMVATVEDSPWHREANVAVHTQMVMDKVDESVYQLSETERVVALLIALFHDTGKPLAEEVITKPDGEKYRRYAGHEQLSAVAFMDVYASDSALGEQLRDFIDMNTARAIRWVIENHLPYGLKNPEKIKNLVFSLHEVMAHANLSVQVFYASLLADCCGRISDDHPTKIQAVKDWISELAQQSVAPQRGVGLKTLILTVGPSASGKSTYIREHIGPYAFVHSRDEFIIEYFRASPVFNGETGQQLYDRAWEFSTTDKNFEKEFHAKFTEAVQSDVATIVVDMTNGSKKVRNRFISFARQHGYAVHAVEFWVSLETLIKRNSTRERSIPRSSIVKQFMVASTVTFAEADFITPVLMVR